MYKALCESSVQGPTQLEEVLEVWRAAFLCSIDALRKQNANLSRPLATRATGGTSIVIVPPVSSEDRARVEVVQWKDDPNRKQGYIVGVDSEMLLIPVVHVGSKRYATDYSNAEILVAQTGVTYTRAKRKGVLAERNELPKHWQRIMEMWKMALHRSQVSELQTISPADEQEASELLECTQLKCAFCGDSKPLAPSSSDCIPPRPTTPSETGEVCVCRMCMMEMHKSCCQRVCNESLVVSGVDGRMFQTPSADEISGWTGGFTLPSIFTKETLRLKRFHFNSIPWGDM